jgi:hypothetical protein
MAKKKKATGGKRRTAPAANKVNYSNLTIKSGEKEWTIDELSALMLFDECYRKHEVKQGVPNQGFMKAIQSGLVDLGAKEVNRTAAWACWTGQFDKDFEERNDEYIICGKSHEFIDVFMAIGEAEDAFEDKIGTVEFYIGLSRKLNLEFKIKSSPADAYRVWRRTPLKVDQVKKNM